MKKKRLYLITIIALLAALFGSGGGTAWGQAYRKGYVYSGNEPRTKLRRGDATLPGSKGYIRDSTNVNNEFGAGESAIIGNGLVKEPAYTHGLNNTPDILRVGSEFSKNVVIDIFDSNGGAAGKIKYVHIKDAGNNPTSYTPGPEVGDRIYFDSLSYNPATDPGTLTGFGDLASGYHPIWPSPAVPLKWADTKPSAYGGSDATYYGLIVSAVKIDDSTAVFPVHNHVTGSWNYSFKINISNAGGQG